MKSKLFLTRKYYRVDYAEEAYHIEVDDFTDGDAIFYNVVRLPHYEIIIDSELKTKIIKEVKDSND